MTEGKETLPMAMVDLHESPEQLIASLQRRRTAKLVGVIFGLVAALVIGSLTVVVMFAS
jgi:hypothetical protein